MRKHLYRAFKKDSPTQTLCGSSQIKINGETYRGEWVYGYLASSHHIDEYKEMVFDGIAIEMFKERHIVIPKTICEYTGLTDKNGNKIFEGDIVKVVTEDTHEERFIEVGIGEFTDDGSGDLFIGAYLKYDGFTVSAGQIKECGSNGVEIIGNIYDNPELLE